MPEQELLHVVGDSETNGLLMEFDDVHVMAFCEYKSKTDDQIFVFTDKPVPMGHPYTKYIKGGLREGIEFMMNRCAEVVIHNFFQYDYWVFNHIAPDLFNIHTAKPWDAKWQDSLVQSRVQWHDRPTPRGYKGAHGLAAWGARCGVHKPEIEDWTTWDGKMLTRVVEDIRINARTKRMLDKEKRMLKECGVDTTETYERAKQTSFWMGQQGINGWKANVELMRKYADELDVEIVKLAEAIEPNLPPTIKNKGKVTYEEFAKGWSAYADELGDESVRKITQYPPTKYRMMKRKGETKRVEIKPLAKPTFSSTNKKIIKTYSVENVVTGEVVKTIFGSLKEARDACKELNGTAKPKDCQWKALKRESEGLEYDTHTVNHFGLDSNRYDGVIAAPHTRITFEKSTMSQHDVVKGYLLNKCGWIPDDYNYKKDKDGKDAKICRDKQSGRLIRLNKFTRKWKDEFGLEVIEHDGIKYLMYNYTLRRSMPEWDSARLRTSPKLTESSYETINGSLGQSIAKYNTLQHRRRTLENPKHDEKGWLNMVRADGRMSAGATVFGTSTGRMTQWGIVNTPSSAAVFGAQMREVWGCEEGTSVISVDMNSAQLVLLCNFMGDPDFTYAVTKGKEDVEFKRTEDGRYYCSKLDKYLDPTIDKYLNYDEENDLYVVYTGTDAHSFNSIQFTLNEESDIITARATQDEDLIHKISNGRKKAKNGIYCLLFGGGDEKFAKTIKVKTTEEGARIKQTYFTRLPKIKALLDRLEDEFKATKKALGQVFGKTHPICKGGFITVAGAYLWCNSPHKILNYLLMGSEAQVQNEAVNWACRQMLDKGLMKLNGRKPAIGARLLCAYHDENSWEVPNEMVHDAKAVIDEMYGTASKALGLLPETLVTGTGKVGKNWLDVH